MYLPWFITLAALAASNSAAAAPGPRGDRAAGPIEEILVISHPLSAEGLALSSDVLAGEELTRKLQSSIGDTVGSQPGVHSANFGQAASRPVIHGLSGPRVRILEDRIDALDVSVTSADHAVTIEPFIADRIEILKGPSTLLYGSGAIGGVVDVHTGRIPHDPAQRPVSGRFEGRLGNNADRRTAAMRLDGGKGRIAWHADGFTRNADDYAIPGYAESARLRALEAAENPETEAHAQGRLPGSALESSGGAVGASLVGARGFVGASISLLDSRYGLPGGHEHTPEAAGHGAETPEVDLDQTRVDVEAGLADPLPGFASVNLRLAVNDYQHEELEPSGEVATVFDNEAVEARVELTHQPIAEWDGAFGLQFIDRDFSAVGEEAFIAPVDTRSVGAFWVGERSFDRFDLEGGVRLESVKVDPSEGASRDFTAYSASLGMVIPFAEAWSIGLLADHSARAPIAEELFSDGPHLATSAYQLGDPDLEEERASSLSADLRYADNGWFVSGTLYYTRFQDYIYDTPTGQAVDGLPVFLFRQDDAAYIGFDAQVHGTVAAWARGALELRALFDTVAAELDVAGNDQIPRLPPTRYGVGASADHGILRATVDFLWITEQDDVADFELPSDAYGDLRAFIGADLPFGADTTLTLFLQGRNLTDDEQRQHASFIKDLAPMPGRTVEAGIRARF